MGAIATAAGARLIVRDDAGQVVTAPGHEAGPDGAAPAPGQGSSGRNAIVTPVLVDGTQVGTVRLGFGPTPGTSAQQIAWSWILVAALVAVGMAVIAAWFVSGRISKPLGVLTGAVRSFAAGHRQVRADADALGAPGELGELARSFNATADVVTASEDARRRMAWTSPRLAHTLVARQAGLEELEDGLAEPEPERCAGCTRNRGDSA